MAAAIPAIPLPAPLVILSFIFTGVVDDDNDDGDNNLIIFVDCGS